MTNTLCCECKKKIDLDGSGVEMVTGDELVCPDCTKNILGGPSALVFDLKNGEDIKQFI